MHSISINAQAGSQLTSTAHLDGKSELKYDEYTLFTSA
jgi:hypothetical protein